MSKPFISILLMTYRLGGIDVIAQTLKRQTFQDYELVLVDCLYSLRHKRVRDYLESQIGNKFVLVEPSPNTFIADSINCWMACRNTALRNATGENLLSWVDYCNAPSDCLEKHRDAIVAHGNSMGPHIYCKMPAPDADFPSKLTIEQYSKYVRSKDARKYDVSIFPSIEFNSAILLNNQIEIDFGPYTQRPPEGLVEEDPNWIGIDAKRTLPRGCITWDYYHAKNEAVPKRYQDAAGEYPPDMDGGAGYADMYMGERIQKLMGCLWFEPGNPVYVFLRDWVFPDPILTRGAPEQYALLQKNRANLLQPLQA